MLFFFDNNEESDVSRFERSMPTIILKSVFEKQFESIPNEIKNLKSCKERMAERDFYETLDFLEKQYASMESIRGNIG